MKVQFYLTIKLTPESRGELIDHYGAVYREFRERVEAATASGNIELPAAQTQVRWLLDSGRWDSPATPQE